MSGLKRQYRLVLKEKLGTGLIGYHQGDRKRKAEENRVGKKLETHINESEINVMEASQSPSSAISPGQAQSAHKPSLRQKPRRRIDGRRNPRHKRSPPSPQMGRAAVQSPVYLRTFAASAVLG